MDNTVICCDHPMTGSLRFVLQTIRNPDGMESLVSLRGSRTKNIDLGVQTTGGASSDCANNCSTLYCAILFRIIFCLLIPFYCIKIHLGGMMKLRNVGSV